MFDFYGVFFNDSSMDCMAYCIDTLKTSFQCGAVDIKRFYLKHVLHKYGNPILHKANYTQQSTGRSTGC